MRKLWLNTAAGAAGGLLGAWTMNRFQAGLKRVLPKEPGGGGEPATVQAAERVTETATGHGLTAAQKETAGPAVHYGFGALVGAVYGMLAAKAPVAKTGLGAVYGAAVWLLADEIGVPAAGLSKPPADVPLSKHAAALASHLVYGLTVEGARWTVGKVLV